MSPAGWQLLALAMIIPALYLAAWELHRIHRGE